MKRLLDTATGAALWSLDRVMRIAIFVGILYVINWLVPGERSVTLLKDATVSEFGQALILPMLVAIWFWHVMGDRE